MSVATPNDPKLSDRGVRRGTCTVGGKAAVEAGAVTHGAVRCSAWLGVSGFMDSALGAIIGGRAIENDSGKNKVNEPENMLGDES